ncbi:Hint domain-containing protein [Histidinibacterium aquaticum]|nr:Hint domain-containing protein [Histidinibacterium aquaticum]
MPERVTETHDVHIFSGGLFAAELNRTPTDFSRPVPRSLVFDDRPGRRSDPPGLPVKVGKETVNRVTTGRASISLALGGGLVARPPESIRVHAYETNCGMTFVRFPDDDLSHLLESLERTILDNPELDRSIDRQEIADVSAHLRRTARLDLELGRQPDLSGCFAPETMILTRRGEIRADELKIGDEVITRDRGYEPIRWIGRKRVAATGRSAPVEIAPHVLGNERTLRLPSPHRVLVTGWAAEILTGEQEVMVSVGDLADGHEISVRDGGTVDYVGFLLDRPEVVFADMALCSSLEPEGLSRMDLDCVGADCAPEGRRILTPEEGRALGIVMSDARASGRPSMSPPRIPRHTGPVEEDEDVRPYPTVRRVPGMTLLYPTARKRA